MTAHSAVRREYADTALRYDERWAEYLAETTRRTLAHVALAPGERLLDVGCGTGIVLEAVAGRVPDATLVGADLSFEMLQAARRRAAAAPLVNADAASLPIAGASCDVVVSASSLHFWSDPGRSVSEIARVLRPGGLLVLTDWCSDFLATRVIDGWLRWTRRASYHRVFGSAGCAELLSAAGFRVEAVDRYHVGVIWGMMTLTATLAEPAGRPQR